MHKLTQIDYCSTHCKKDIVHINATVHCLSKEVKALIYDRNIFIIMFASVCSASPQWNKFSQNRHPINSKSNFSHIFKEVNPSPVKPP